MHSCRLIVTLSIWRALPLLAACLLQAASQSHREVLPRHCDVADEEVDSVAEDASVSLLQTQQAVSSAAALASVALEHVESEADSMEERGPHRWKLLEAAAGLKGNSSKVPEPRQLGMSYHDRLHLPDTKLRERGGADPDTNLSAALAPRPLLQLHIPKTAGGFATTVGHFVCADELPKHVYLQGPGDLRASNYNCMSDWARTVPGHDPLYGADFDELAAPHATHVVTMVREPRQRLLSGFYHNRHDCPRIRLARFCAEQDDFKTPECVALHDQATDEELQPYAACVGSCTARMIAGFSCGGTSPQPDALKRSLMRLDELAFVGLTEEYDRSVCLFHMRFGGQCLEVEFINSHLGRSKNHTMSAQYDEEMVTPFVDVALAADYQLYERAKKRFWSEVKEYGATDEACERLCPAFSTGADASKFMSYSSYRAQNWRDSALSHSGAAAPVARPSLATAFLMLSALLAKITL